MSDPSPSSSSSVDPPDVDSFLRDLTVLERETEVNRILSAFKYNPFDILNVAHTATKEEIAKAYRSASLQVHPDKFPSGPKRDQAQQAFTAIAAAKESLNDEAKREELDGLIDQARQRVLTEKTADQRKKRKVTTGDEAASSSSSTTTDSEDDVSKHPEYDLWIRAQFKELIIEREWRKRQLLKAAAAEEALAASEKARRAEERERKESAEKEWEEGRDTRINSWRDFQKGALGKKKGPMRGLMKAPKTSTVDQENAYIRRPVTHQSSDK